MVTTYTKGSSGDILDWQGDLTVSGSQVFEGGVALGDAVSDVTVIKGRLATSTAAGAALDIDATTCTYPEGLELRYNMADWADVATFTEANGMYLRMETSEANATGTLQGATIYGVANNVGVQNLKGLLSYAYIKGATAKTVATAYGVHAELTWDAGAASTTITTEMAPVLAKITGGVTSDYTKLHGVIVRVGDMDGASRTYGNGLLIEDDAAIAGAITWTKAISITSAATAGLDMTGAIVTGINIAGSAMTTGISVGLTGKTYATGIAVGVSGGTLTDALKFAGTVTRGINFTGATIAAGSAYNAAFCIGQRGGTAQTVTLTNAADLHWNPVQFNVIVGGVNPSNTATWNMIYQNVAHATADMANLRLKGADWTFDIQKNIKDVYAFQGEIDFSVNAVAVGGEASVLGLVMNAGSAGVTGALRGAIISMQGTVTSGSAYGLEIRGTMTTSSGDYAAIKANGTPIANYDYGIIFGEETTNNQGPTNLFWLPDGSSGDIGPVINNALVPAVAPDGTTMGADACIRVILNATPYYIPLYNSLHA